MIHVMHQRQPGMKELVPHTTSTARTCTVVEATVTISFIIRDTVNIVDIMHWMTMMLSHGCSQSAEQISLLESSTRSILIIAADD